jgi:hypothetical protein
MRDVCSRRGLLSDVLKRALKLKSIHAEGYAAGHEDGPPPRPEIVPVIVVAHMFCSTIRLHLQIRQRAAK